MKLGYVIFGIGTVVMVFGTLAVVGACENYLISLKTMMFLCALTLGGGLGTMRAGEYIYIKKKAAQEERLTK